MKAIILAGGKGTRLKPLTEDIPKPLVPFMDKPLLFRIIHQLYEANISEIMLTLGHQASAIRETVLRAKLDTNCKIYFSEEETPLGTAGSVLRCKDFITEATLIISGDCVLDASLNALIEYFTQTTALVTIATTTEADPREFGTIITDQNNQVTAFIEKPVWEEVRTDRVNTGIYIIRPELIPIIEELHRLPCDFGKDVFPEMLKQGLPIQTYLLNGYWCDIGTPESYLCAHQKLTKQSSVSNVIWEGTKIDSSARIEGSVLCNHVQVGRNAIIRNAFIGHHTIVEDNACIVGAKVDGNMRISKDTVVTGRLTKEPPKSASVLEFGDGELVGAFSYAFLSKLCRVISLFFHEADSIGLVYENHPQSMTIGTWIQAGLMAGGREVRYQVGMSLPAFRWMIREGVCDGGIYITNHRIKLLNGHGNDLNRQERRTLHKLYESDPGEIVVHQFYGAYPLHSPEEYYYSMLMRHFPVFYYDFSGLEDVYTKDRKACMITRYILEKFPDAPIFVSQYSGYAAEQLAKAQDRYIVYCGSKIGDMMDEMEKFMHIPGVYEQYLMYTDEFAFCLGVYATEKREEASQKEIYTCKSEFSCLSCENIHLLGKLCNRYGVEHLQEEGFVRRDPHGNVHITAEPKENRLRLYVESFNEEFGKELLLEWENKIKKLV